MFLSRWYSRAAGVLGGSSFEGWRRFRIGGSVVRGSGISWSGVSRSRVRGLVMVAVVVLPVVLTITVVAVSPLDLFCTLLFIFVKYKDH